LILAQLTGAIRAGIEACIFSNRSPTLMPFQFEVSRYVPAVESVHGSPVLAVAGSTRVAIGSLTSTSLFARMGV
jgi:hypothetical protein